MKGHWWALLAALAVAVAIIPAPAPRGPEAVIAALPGVGEGWLDTLRRVAGRVDFDTISALEAWDEAHSWDSQDDMIGVFERWHNLISVAYRPIAYQRYSRHWEAPWCPQWYEYRHPVSITGNPAGNLAHEFGHKLQFELGLHRMPSDGLVVPAWAADQDERFADRFARAMLALRGWADPDPADQVLNHQIRFRLMRSYWPKEE